MPTPEVGTLFLVATPIGNRQDLSPRAIDVLGEVALVAAEDTRRSGALLAHFGVRQPMISCFEHNERRRAGRIVEVLAGGDDVALVCSAGSPGISDPGYAIVRAALEAGGNVVAVPGPSAALLALQVSGLPTDTFTFVGFPPKRVGKRRTFLRQALRAPGTVVLYVPARDTGAVLDELVALSAVPPRVAAARELTKVHEEVLRGAADEVAARIRRRLAGEGVWRGEVTLVVAKARGGDEPPDDGELEASLQRELEAGLDRKTALKRVRAETGVPRARLYGILEDMKRGRDDFDAGADADSHAPARDGER